MVRDHLSKGHLPFNENLEFSPSVINLATSCAITRFHSRRTAHNLRNHLYYYNVVKHDPQKILANRKISAEWIRENKDRYKAITKEWRQKNADHIKKRERKYREAKKQDADWVRRERERKRLYYHEKKAKIIAEFGIDYWKQCQLAEGRRKRAREKTRKSNSQS